ncbi:MAG: P-loop NTPase fold protein [Geothrix sp.]|nr:P-loop NTPase fold protein [Geothrix sp.]
MGNNHESVFSSDQPVSNKLEDQLNRAAFSERVSEILASVPLRDNLVVGIHGPWGDGKTSVLNLIRAELGGYHDIIVRDFNPWRLTDEEQMLRGFITMLASSIGESLATPGERAQSMFRKWAGKGRLVTKPLSWVWKPAETADELLAALGKVAKSGDSLALDDLRGRLVECLGGSLKRVVVLIDDVDRLDKHETYTLFKLIKACADFPNVCYLLAFDDVAVAKTLGDRYGEGGELAGRSFLEKIIQVPLKLPAPMKEDLRRLCFQNVELALARAGIELTENQAREFVSNFDRGVLIQLETPRAAKRYGNALMFALPLLKGEVDVVDLLLLEALRSFYPTIYDRIRSEQTAFSGLDQERGGRPDDTPRAVQLLAAELDGLDPRSQESVKALLAGLFPRLRPSYTRGGHYGTSWLQSWAERKRVCSPDYCPRYFTYSIPHGDIRDSEIDVLIEAAVRSQQEMVFDLLKGHFESDRSRRLIGKLRAIETTINSQAAPILCIAIAGLAKHIPNPPAFFRHAEPPSQAAILLSHLVRRLSSSDDRSALAQRIIQAADPLWFGAECLRWFYVTDDADKAEHNALTMEQLVEVRSTLVERVRASSIEGQAMFNPEVPQEVDLLIEWRRLDGREPVQAHLTRVFDNDSRQIFRFLEAMSGQPWGVENGLPLPREIGGDHLKSIEFLIGLNLTAELIQKYSLSEFENPQRRPDPSKGANERLAEQFMYAYKKRGEEK